MTLADFKDWALWRETVSLAVAANASAPVWRGTAAQLASSPNPVLGVNSPSGAFPANRWFFAPIKALGLPATPVDMEVEAMSSHELRVHLRAGTYAYFVHLLAPHGWTRFSDNYFDMAAGEARTVTVRNDAHPLRPDILQVASR